MLFTNLWQVGNAAGMSSGDWVSDITAAKDAHIDGFVMNIAPQDSYTDSVLQKAYDAAETVGNFSMFLSFDYESGGPWSASDVITKINAYKNKPAQFYYQGKPLVTTFEGTNNVGDWPRIKSATDTFVMPTWTSLGASGIASVLNVIDGFASWDAWPEGAQDMTDAPDKAFMSAITGKPYMMPVSPWFYTNLPQWNKNWLWRGDSLWHERWAQAIELRPAIVEVGFSVVPRNYHFCSLLIKIQIVTWNDYGESHYVGPIHESGIPEGASDYVSKNPHDGWRALLPYYIDAYKTGNTTVHTPHGTSTFYRSNHTAEDKITYWYRPNPSTAGSTGGTTGNNPSQGQPALAPGVVSQDKVFFTALVQQPSVVTAQIGNGSVSKFHANTVGLNHFSVPMNNQTGPVKFAIVRNGKQVKSATGPDITDDCTDGKVNWNAIVGSSDTQKST